MMERICSKTVYIEYTIVGQTGLLAFNKTKVFSLLLSW